MIGIPSNFTIGGVKYTVNKNEDFNSDCIITTSFREAVITVNKYCKGQLADDVRLLKFYDILFSLFFERLGRYDLSKDEELCMSFARHYLSFRNSFTYNLNTILYPKTNNISIGNKFGEFTLGGIKYIIVSTEYTNKETKGQVNTGDCIITIPTYSRRSVLTFNDKINTLYHELTHVLALFSFKDDADLFDDEFFTCSFADFLTEYEMSICKDESYEGIKFDYWSEFKKCYDEATEGFLYKSVLFL